MVVYIINNTVYDPHFTSIIGQCRVRNCLHEWEPDFRFRSIKEQVDAFQQREIDFFVGRF